MNANDICPNQEDGRHRFHIYRIADAYERTIVPPEQEAILFKNIDSRVHGALQNVISAWELTYDKVEYAYSGCNCGAARKTRIMSDKETI